MLGYNLDMQMMQYKVRLKVHEMLSKKQVMTLDFRTLT